MPQNLKQITSLRFFAAMWVVAFHFWPSLTPAVPALVGRGYLGVELFFVLSGFILSHVYLKSFGEGRFRYPDFLWARLARIYPVHIATLAGLGLMVAAAAMAGMSVSGNVIVWPSFPGHLLLVQSWGLAPQGGWNHPSWSISAEWFAYLTFPVSAWIAWRLKQRPWVAVGLALALIAVLYPAFQRLTDLPLTQATIVWGAVRIVPCFAYGCAIYLLWNSGALKTRVAAKVAALSGVAAVTFGALFGAPDPLMVALFGGLIVGLAAMASTGSRLLTAPVWVYLGEVSFSIYMVVVPWELLFGRAASKVLHLGGDVLPPVAWLMMTLGVIPAAMVLHHLVERPAREAMRRHGVPFLRRSRALDRGGLVEPAFQPIDAAVPKAG